MIGLVLAFAPLSSIAVAQSYQPAFRPDQLIDRAGGSSNEVVVLGSPHLSGLRRSFRPEMVEPIASRLIAWRPTAVAVETLSGGQCDSLRRRPPRFRQTVNVYCYDTRTAGRSTALDVPGAIAEAERILADWPSTPNAAQRRRLAAVFLASGEPASAAVQWLRLPAVERRSDGALTAELANFLNSVIRSNDETYLIGVQVAAAAGLERVWGVDDQSYAAEPTDSEAYGRTLSLAWANTAGASRRESDDALMARIGEPNGVLDLYLGMNDPSQAMLAYRSDWGAALIEPSPEAYGRRYVAYWESRNLRMVANIREVLGFRPGTRLLAIVGASHKGYYEAYLAQMRDVVLVDVIRLLRQDIAAH